MIVKVWMWVRYQCTVRTRMGRYGRVVLYNGISIGIVPSSIADVVTPHLPTPHSGSRAFHHIIINESINIKYAISCCERRIAKFPITFPRSCKKTPLPMAADVPPGSHIIGADAPQPADTVGYRLVCNSSFPPFIRSTDNEHNRTTSCSVSKTLRNPCNSTKKVLVSVLSLPSTRVFGLVSPPPLPLLLETDEWSLLPRPPRYTN